MSNQTRKKVLFLITKSNWGGAQRYVYDLAVALKDQYDIAVALGGDGVLRDMLTEAGIRTIPIPGLQRDISVRQELMASRTIAHILERERPDILHVNSSKAGGIGALLGRIYGVPKIIFTAHGWAFNEDRPSWQKFILGAIHFVTIMLAHHTIAVSNGLKHEMRWPGAQSRMTVIHPGRTISSMLSRSEAREALALRAPALRERMGLPWIGTIAELHPIKRLNTAIDAMVGVDHDTAYVIIGDGELREELEHSVASRALGNRIFFTGAITEAAQYLKAFDMFVLPSRSEAFGYVLLEAGAAELPVVATNVGGIPDIIKHGRTGTLIPHDDVAALHSAITTYLTDTETAVLHGKALHAHVQKFSIEEMAAKTAEVYER